MVLLHQWDSQSLPSCRFLNWDAGRLQNRINNLRISPDHLLFQPSRHKLYTGCSAIIYGCVVYSERISIDWLEKVKVLHAFQFLASTRPAEQFTISIRYMKSSVSLGHKDYEPALVQQIDCFDIGCASVSNILEPDDIIALPVS
jgi:hypothetical protein